MRRLIALLSLLGLTNLVFVQAATACPLLRVADSRATVVHDGHGSHHGGHDMAGSTSHEMTTPDESAPHSSCLTMSACAVTLAVSDTQVVLANVTHPMVAVSTQEQPASLTAAPELPPPRR